MFIQTLETILFIFNRTLVNLLYILKGGGLKIHHCEILQKSSSKIISISEDDFKCFRRRRQWNQMKLLIFTI
jgi:hypothetical protein